MPSFNFKHNKNTQDQISNQAVFNNQMQYRDKTSFSRYNKRYFNKQDNQQQQRFNNMVDEFDPVSSWIPFLIFGACAVLVCLIWLFRVLGSQSTIMQNSGLFTAGIIILVGTFIVGIILVAATAHITAKKLQIMTPGDAIFTALGKITIVLIFFLVVWVICMFIAA